MSHQMIKKVERRPADKLAACGHGESIHQYPLFCGRVVNYFGSRNEHPCRKSLSGKELRRYEKFRGGNKFTTVTPKSVTGEIVVSASDVRVYDKGGIREVNQVVTRWSQQ